MSKRAQLSLGVVLVMYLTFLGKAVVAESNRNWVEIDTPDAPAERTLFAMAYDPSRDRVVLFGGVVGHVNSPVYEDTWEYDGNNWELIETPDSPPGLREAYMEYFPPLQGTILFGGSVLTPSGLVAMNETWLYDGLNWTKLETAQSPNPRVGHSMAYDEQREVIVMFGGQGGGTFNDTWEFDGDNWIKINPPVSPTQHVGPRRNTDMTYDKARGKIVLYGGNDNWYSFNDTWEYDGVSWEKIITPSSPDIPRSSPAITYLDSEELVFLFGGVDGQTVSQSTWVYNGSTWSELSTVTDPPARGGHEIVYKTATDAIVLFGGDISGTSVNFNDTWEFRLQVIPGAVEVIVFFADFDGTGNNDVWAVYPDGSNITQLTDTPILNEVWAQLSPDGRSLLTVARITPGPSRYDHSYFLTDLLTGTTQELLSQVNLKRDDPSFSPDGQQLVFTRNRNPVGYEDSDVWLADLDGGYLRRITNTYYNNCRPHMSIDWIIAWGQGIMFQARSGRVATIDSNGSYNAFPQTVPGYSDLDPRWSHDGTRIVFDIEGIGIYSMDANGQNVAPLVTNASAGYGFFSPDDTRIAFGQNGDLHIMDADGSNKQLVLSHPANLRINDFGVLAITNIAPFADAGGPYSGYEGSPVELKGFGSDPDGDPITFAWDLDDDGEYDDAFVETVEETFYDDGIYTVSLKVIDVQGKFDTDDTEIYVENIAPTATLSSVGPVAEGSPAIISFTDQFDPSPIDTAAGFEYAFDCDDGSGYGSYTASNSAQCVTNDNGIRTVRGKIRDKDGGESEYNASVTVDNVSPSASLSGATSVDEGQTEMYSYTVSDPGADTFTLSVESCGVGGILSNSVFDGLTGAGSFDCAFPDGPDSTTVGVNVADDDGGSGSDSLTVTVNNLVPVLTVDVSNQEVQYSDFITDVSFTATDVAADVMTSQSSWNVDGGSFNLGVPSGLSLSICTDDAETISCAWILSGFADVAAGTYTVRLTVTDDDGGVSIVDTTIVVQPEDASLSFDIDNPVAVKVAEPGGDSGEFTLVVYVEETEPDLSPFGAGPGDISRAEVSMSLVPVGPGSPVEGVCTLDPVGGSGYDTVMPVSCSFDNVPVNTYSVEVAVQGGYYVGSANDALTIYDPSLGFTTGGGWFYWPGTADPETGYPGDKTNFGYNMKYKTNGSNIRGSLLLIRHLPDGTIYRVKSNTLYGLALGEDPSIPMGWASFSGKCTYLEPGWLEPIGNHEFLVYVEDLNEPGSGNDQIWIEIYDKDGTLIVVMSIEREAQDHTETLGGGNIVAPH